MPIDKISERQKQGRFFDDLFINKLNKDHKLFKLRDLIDWPRLEENALSGFNAKQYGRQRKDNRLMIALAMLQAMYNGSDAYASEEVQENMYWQYFCGFDYVEREVSVSEATIRRFRDVLGEAGYNEILKELLRVGLKVGALKKKDLDSAIIDTTVQVKNIKHPHDAHLMEKARKEVSKLCKRNGIDLHETYAKCFKYSTLKLWKYKQDSNAKPRVKIMKSMKTRLGRLIRRSERSIESKAILLSKRDVDVLSKAKRIYSQSVLSKKDKAVYKQDNKVIYSFHAPEVECIGKGKLHKPYEFGNKVSIAVSGRGNFILGVKSFHGNPYDGHTLDQAISGIKALGAEPSKYFLDLGYRGHNHSAKSKVYLPNTKKQNLTKEDKLMQKRRSAIEPIIGHLKNYGRMGRNYLKGIKGDIINPLISALGLNLRRIANVITARTRRRTLRFS